MTNTAEFNVDDAVLDKISDLARHAAANRFNLANVQSRMLPGAESVGDDDKFAVFIPVGWKVVYCIEEQPAPLGWCHHFSFSLRIENNEIVAPPPELFFKLILPMFNVSVGPLIHIWKEDIAGIGCATNILYKVENLNDN